VRVLLVSSNLYSQFPAVFPNALGALAPYLRREGHEVRTFHVARRRQMKQIPGLLAEFAPQVVGISAVTCETPIIRPVGEMAKKWNPEVPVVVGGIHGIVAPETLFADPNVEAVCAGEGELAFAEYVHRLEAGQDVSTTPNFAFRKAGRIVRNPPLPFIQDLDSLPMMDRDVADLQETIDANNGVLNVIFSRGCPWTCKFCSNRHIRQAGTGDYARLLSPQKAMEELEQIKARYRFSHVLFRDDTFTWNRDWALEMIHEFRQRFAHPFDIFSRVDCLDDEMLAELAEAGCKHIFIGLDSGNDFVRNEVLHKEQSNDDLFRVIATMRRLGIIPMISNIVGLPYETPEHFKDTIEINKRIHQDKVVFSPTCGACPKIWVFTPWPGSDLYKLCREQGWLKEEPTSSKVYRESVLRMPGFPKDEIDRQFRTFRYQVYKDNFPLHALLFLLYDSKPMQAVFERIPLGLIGGVRTGFLTAFNPTRRKELLQGLLAGSPLRSRASTSSTRSV
jgi:radical SAM superfamily enzyme YgiQ (UPF0313 family)